MSITMTLETRHDDGGKSTLKCEDATWVAVEAAMRRLDQKTYTQVGVSREDGAALVIGGGCGFYNVFMNHPDGSVRGLLSDAEPRLSVSMIVGGQRGECPANKVVDIDLALRCFQEFMEASTRTSELRWDVQR